MLSRNCNRYHTTTRYLWRASLGIIGCALFALLVSSCGENKREVKEVRVDLAQHAIKGYNKERLSSVQPFRVAIASMISPKETFTYYEDLVHFISERMGRPVQFKQCKTYQETNTLLSRGEVDLAFICSGAYVDAVDRGEATLLAVPVCNGKPLYRAYVITNSASGIVSFSGMRNSRFAFTDPMSHTGYAYAVERVNGMGFTAESFFSESFFTYAHDHSIRLVERGTVDGATVDGLVFDYLRHHYPERVSNVRVIERSEYFGIPPVVLPRAAPDSLRRFIQEVLINMHKDSSGRQILDHLLIDRFILGKDEDYDSIRKMRKVLRK